jgi:hypothetical protein
MLVLFVPCMSIFVCVRENKDIFISIIKGIHIFFCLCVREREDIFFFIMLYIDASMIYFLATRL